MNRSEAKNFRCKVMQWSDEYHKEFGVFIDQIYDEHNQQIKALQDELDEIKGRSCEGCMYYDDCPILREFNSEQRELCIQGDFCCNKWEKRQ